MAGRSAGVVRAAPRRRSRRSRRTARTTSAAFSDVLPPGTNGRANLVELAAFLGDRRAPAAQRRPARHVRAPAQRDPRRHGEDDRRRSSRTRASASRPATRRRTYSPRAGLTIVRDRVLRRPPRLRRDARGGDVRPRLRRRRGPPVLHRRAAPRRPRAAQLVRRRRGRQPRDGRGRSGARRPTPRPTCSARPTSSTTSTATRAAACRTTRRTYVAGVNTYIGEAKLDITKMPGEYAAIGRPLGPDPWKRHRRHRDGRRSSAGSSARAAARSSRRWSCAARSSRATARGAG